ncbi:MAG: thioredoxin family protein [Elusimicrobia bacterium]|nr:thioredoxin family protein [Candidatus Obscuribacterium magneticum]
MTGKYLKICIYPRDLPEGKNLEEMITAILQRDGIRGVVSTMYVVPELLPNLGIETLPAIKIDDQVVIKGYLPSSEEISTWLENSSPPKTNRKPRERWPGTVDEAATWFIEGIDPENKEALKKMSDQEFEEASIFWGMGIRNSYGLWAKNNALLQSCGTNNVDDASAIIISAIKKRLRNNSGI